MKTRSQARAGDDSTLELLIYDVIGSGLFGDGVTSKAVLTELAAKPNAKTIAVRLNSPGGSVFDGLAIYNALKSSPARVVVTVEGLAASAASLVAMAGDEIRMGKGSMLMIHEARTYLDGVNAADLARERDVLEKLNASFVDIYAARAAAKSKTRDDVIAAMAAETYFTAEEAVAWGFADRIEEAVAAPADVVALARTRPGPRELITRFAAIARQMEKAMSYKRIAKALRMKVRAEDAPAEEDVLEQVEEVVQEVDAQASEIEALKAEIDALKQQIAELLAASGETAPADAVAAVRAGQSARRTLAKMEARVAELERAAEAGERGALVAKLRAERKVTPAMEREFVATMSLEALRAFARVAPRVVAEAVVQPLAAVGPAALRTANGKTWGELRPIEKAALKTHDPELYSAMRAASGA